MMSQHLIVPTSLVVLAYLLGSVSSAIIVCKLFRLPDPRTQGSNNPGATNVLRIGGRLPALLTFLGDSVKAVIPVLCLKWLDVSELWQLAGLSAAFIGHLYPCFFRFQGGKGVATLIGGLLAFSWMLGGAFLGIWLVAFLISRISAVGAIVASLSTPVIAYMLFNIEVAVILLGLVTLLLWRHQRNIKDLLARVKG